MSALVEKLQTASRILLEAEKEVQPNLVDLPVAEAAGILAAARHLIDRVTSYASPSDEHWQTINEP